MFLDFASVWEEVADAVPDVDAIVQGERRVTYAEYDHDAARFAAALEAAGLSEGAKVGLYLHNGPEYLVAQYGAFKLRAVPVNVNYRYLEDELATCSTTPTPRRWCSTRRSGDRSAASATSCRSSTLLVEIDDGGGAPRRAPCASRR